MGIFIIFFCENGRDRFVDVNSRCEIDEFFIHTYKILTYLIWKFPYEKTATAIAAARIKRIYSFCTFFFFLTELRENTRRLLCYGRR